MNTDKSIKYKKTLKESFNKGLITKKKYKKELKWVSNYLQSKSSVI
jgi:hypothetical protein